MVTSPDQVIPAKKYPKLRLDLEGFPGVAPEPKSVLKSSKIPKPKGTKGEETLETLYTQPG
jgi:hypothetical protein